MRSLTFLPRQVRDSSRRLLHQKFMVPMRVHILEVEAFHEQVRFPANHIALRRDQQAFSGHACVTAANPG